MKILSTRNVLSIAAIFALALTFPTRAAAADPPNPVLLFLGQEVVEVGGKQMTRYYFDVVNKDAYPAELFAASPGLPPCGSNTNASRTWVDIYAQNGKRLNSFCALGKPGDLTRIWFALDSDEVPPSWVYIEMTDRQTNKKYKSNLADTTM